MRETIGPSEAGQRFDRFCRKYFKPYPEIKLGDIYARIRKGSIKVNDQKAAENYRLQKGDEVTRDDDPTTEKDATDYIYSKEEKIAALELDEITPLILAENEHRLVLNKPADMVAHGGEKHTNDLSCNDYLQAYLQVTDQLPDSPTFTPAFCFRLDKDTSGVMIAAKTYPALKLLNRLIRERKVDKTYATIVEGELVREQEVDAPLFVGFNKQTGRSQTFINTAKGKEARTRFVPLAITNDQHLGTISLVKVKIFTGRMHQIRVHAASIDHPVIGDLTYGNNALNRIVKQQHGITRQLLHSWSYGFFDQLTDKERLYTAPLPDDFSRLFPDYATADPESVDSGN